MHTRPVRVIGSYLSPYVRKVLVCLALKRVPYAIDPIVPFYGDEGFARLSPLRRVPVLVDDALALADSTVICEYLDERYPDPPLLPADPAARARARWFEEYADSKLGEAFIWHLFNQVTIRRFVWGEPPDEAVLHTRAKSRSRRRWTTCRASCPPQAGCSARPGGPTSRWRPSSAMPPGRAGVSMPSAGRAPPASCSARSPCPPSKRCAPSRSCAFAPRLPSIAKPCKRPAHRWPRAASATPRPGAG